LRAEFKAPPFLTGFTHFFPLGRRAERWRWPKMEEKRKLTEEEFVLQAIKKLRKEPFRGIHSVYSGFNEAFRKYFGTNRGAEEDPGIGKDER
jgi:hypothetical protein